MDNTTNNELVLKAPAKINLTLEVLNKREDGFHNLSSLFQAISLYDILKFKIIEEDKVKLSSLSKDIPLDEKNLIHKAAMLIKERFSIDSGLEIDIEKNIPVFAGLGGGSSDAASTIMACNKLFELGLSTDEMAKIGLELGSDIPFFFSTGQAKVSGRGDIIENIELPVDYHLVILKPKTSISTAESYSQLKRGLTYSKIPHKLVGCLAFDKFVEQLNLIGNDFEENLFERLPELKHATATLLGRGANIVRLSGTGSAIFGIFKTEQNNIDMTGIFGGDWQVYTVMPISLIMLT
jgi:4-diphosphocytidyl-2-C-methyl-D-erythritol kinase